jgi:membrane-associated protein
VSDLLDAINTVVIDAAGQPWVLAVLFACCVIDGFFPPVPSESLVVGLAAVAVSSGVPNLWLIIAISAAGAVVGDNIAYLIGRRIGTDRFRWMRRPRVKAASERAGRELARRSASYIITARYIPVGRVAVNMTAGATGVPHPRFLGLSILAGLSWAAYSVSFGVVAGSWAEDNPVLAMAIAIVLALAVGLLVDHLVQRRARVRRAQVPAESVEPVLEPDLEPEPDVVGP